MLLIVRSLLLAVLLLLAFVFGGFFASCVQDTETMYTCLPDCFRR